MVVRVLGDPELGQLAWHLAMASRYAATHQLDLARTETFLAWAMLGTCDAFRDDAMTDFDTPVDPAEANVGDERTIAAFEEAREAAYAFIGHFTSEQRFDLVAVYERVAAVIEDVVARLRSDFRTDERPGEG